MIYWTATEDQGGGSQRSESHSSQGKMATVTEEDVCHNSQSGTTPPSDQKTTSSSTLKKKKKKKGAKSNPPSTKQTLPPLSTSDDPSKTQGSESKSSFEDELEWCIGQLELDMLRTDANKSQKQQNQKNLQSLRGSKTPLPKKRQLMRSLFGDYRAKMKSQPLPDRCLMKQAVKVEPAKPEVIETVGTYYRKSLNSCSADKTSDVVAMSGSNCDSEFMFNFDV